MFKKLEENYRSECCNAKVKARGIPDFIGSDEICTINYVCLKCRKPCKVKKKKVKNTKNET